MPLRYSGQDQAVPAVPSGMNRSHTGARPRGLIIDGHTSIVYDASNSSIRPHASSRAAWLNGGVPGQKNACRTPG